MIIEVSSNILDKLSETERRVIDFINRREADLPEMSIVDIAFDTFSSPSTVSRAIRKCGINGFNELRYKLTRPNQNQEMVSVNEIMNKSLIEATRCIERISIADVLAIVGAIRTARPEKIYVFSRGPTAQVAKEFSLKLELLDYNVTEISDPKIMLNITKNIKRKRLFILFSLNGETPELVESAKNAHDAGASVISCCCSDRSPLLKYSNFYLIGYKHENIAIKEYEVTSRLPLFIISRILIDYLVQQETRPPEN